MLLPLLLLCLHLQQQRQQKGMCDCVFSLLQVVCNWLAAPQQCALGVCC